MEDLEHYIIKNSENRFGALLEMTSYDSTRVSFVVYHIDSDGDNDENTPTLFLEKLVDGYIKWDGCSNLNYGDNGKIHFCSPEDIINMNKAIEFAWKNATLFFQDDDNIDKWMDENESIIPYHGHLEIK